MEGSREIRSLTLRLLAIIFQRFPTSLDLNPLWSDLLIAANSSLEKLPTEVHVQLSDNIVSKLGLYSCLRPYASQAQKILCQCHVSQRS